MRAWFAVISLAILAGVLTGCQTSTAVGGRPHERPIQSIVSLSPSTTEITGNFVRSDKLKGRTSSDNFPMTISAVPIVGDVKPNYEAIAQIKPDLIVYDETLYNESDVAKIKELGIETLVLDANTVAEFIDWLYRYGARTGSETNMADYVDRIEAERARAKGGALDPQPQVAILMGDSPADLMIAGLKTFQADVVREAGGNPVGPEAEQYVPLNVEQLIALKPNVILTTGNPDAILRDPRLSSLPAVQSKRVARVTPDIMLRRGARLDMLLKTLYRFLAASSASMAGRAPAASAPAP